MADYVMLEDIFETTENMTILRDNSYNDDGTDMVAGVDWFKFRETTAANFYVSGNTWIGIGQNSEQLKISRRDADLYTLKKKKGHCFQTINSSVSDGRAIVFMEITMLRPDLYGMHYFLIRGILSCILLKFRPLYPILGNVSFTQNQRIYHFQLQRERLLHFFIRMMLEMSMNCLMSRLYF